MKDDDRAAVGTGESEISLPSVEGSNRYASFMQVRGALGFKAEGRRNDSSYETTNHNRPANITKLHQVYVRQIWLV